MSTDLIRSQLPVGQSHSFPVLDAKQIDEFHVAVSVGGVETRYEDVVLAANRSQVTSILAVRAGKSVSIVLAVPAEGAEPDIVGVVVA